MPLTRVASLTFYIDNGSNPGDPHFPAPTRGIALDFFRLLESSKHELNAVTASVRYPIDFMASSGAISSGHYFAADK